MPDRTPHPIDDAINARRQDLGLRWKDLYDRSGVAQETLRKIRLGLRDKTERTTDSEAKIEAALGWARGSIQRIRDGGRPALASETPPRRFGVVVTESSDYPPEVGDDPFLKDLWDHPHATLEDRMAAIRGVLGDREARRRRRHAESRASGGSGKGSARKQA